MTVGHRSLRGSARRGFAVAAMSALVLASLPLSGTAFGAQENTEYLTGADNVEAALAWSQFTFDSAAAVAVGRDDVFADSLASGLIQGLGDGVPLLLTDSDTLDPAVSAEITRLGATTVHILGGETAISSGVEDALEADGLTIHRHAGASRVETAIDIASKHGAAATTAIVARAFASGADPTQAFADSLAAGAWAAEDDLPILLTQTNELHEAVEAYLASSDVDAVNVVGGTSAVSDAVVSSIEALGIDVTRVSGATRFDTAIAIAAARGFDSAADAADGVVVVEGQAADSWAAGFAAAAYGAGAGPATLQAIGTDGRPVVLVNGDDVPASTLAFLADGGGINVVCFSNATACDAASAAAGNGVAVEGNATFLDSPELVSVELGSGDEDDDEQAVIFTFDENVNDDAVNEGDFVLYDYAGNPLTETGDSDVDDNQVEITFDYHDAQLATTAAVRQGAVQDDDGNESIEGSAPLQDVSLDADETDAPDITDVELDADDETITITFDEAVDTDNLDSGDVGIVDGDGDTQSTFTESAITINEDRDEVTIILTDAGGIDDEDDFGRLFIEDDSVTGDDSGNGNARQSFDLGGDEEDLPRLISASVELGDETDDDDDNDDDTVVYRFSEAVDGDTDNNTATNFFAVLADGSTQFGNTGDDSDTDGTRIEIEFADGELDESVVRVGVLDGAAGEEDTPANDNIGLQTVGVDGADLAAGETLAPDVESITVEEDMDSFGNVDGYIINIQFDEVVDDFDDTDGVAYEVDGDESDEDLFADCSIDDDDESLVTCEVDQDDTDDVVAIALQRGAATDDDTYQSHEYAAEFPGDSA